MTLLKIILLLILFSCGSIPKDPSIPEQNNHLRLEIEIDGNISVGIHGKSFTSFEELQNSTLSFKPIHEGIIELWSERCGRSFSIGYKKNQTIKINLAQLMPSSNPMKCSYRIIRRIIGADNPMIGYLGLNYHYETSPLKVEVNGKIFNGVSWLQAREGMIIPSKSALNIPDSASILENKIIKIYPTSNSGQLTFRGCGVTYPPILFEATPVIIDLADVFPNGLKVSDSCDYEITSSNFENPLIESNMFVLNVYKRETSWLETPFIEYDNIFNILKILFNNPYILGISIDDKECASKTCSKQCPKNKECIVRAITSSGRFFWGSVKNGKLQEVK